MKPSTAKHMFWWTFLALLAAVATTSAGEDASHPWIDEPAPDFELESTEGQPIALGDFRGEKLVVIHFAASW